MKSTRFFRFWPLVFLLVLAWPAARHALRRDIQKVRNIADGANPGGSTDLGLFFYQMAGSEEQEITDFFASSGKMRVASQYRPLLNQHPDDLGLWLLAAMSEPGPLSDSKVNWRQKNLQVVEKKFPREPVVLALQWVYQAGGYTQLNTRPPGPSSDSSPAWSPSRTFDKGRPTDFELLPPGAYKGELALIQRAKKMEPENAFWWQSEVHCLLALRRDDETWAVLREGAQKTIWDDHLYNATLLQFQARRRHGLSQGAGDDVTFVASVLFPHYARQRECARQIKDNCAGLHLLGQHQKALRGALDLARISQLQQQFSKPYIGSLVGSAMMAIGLCAGPMEFPTKPFAPTRVQSPNSARRGYVGRGARRLGFVALAREADALDAQNVQWRAKRKPWNWMIFGGMDDANAVRAFTFEGTRVALLAPIPIVLLLALVLGTLRRNRRLRAILRVHESLARTPRVAGWRLAAWSLTFLMLLWMMCAATLVAQASSELGNTFWQKIALNWANVDQLGLMGMWLWLFVPAAGVVWAFWRAYFGTRAPETGLWARVKRILQPAEDGLVQFDLTPLFLLSVTISCTLLYFAAIMAWFGVPVADESWRESARGYSWAVLMVFVIVALLPLWSLAARARNRRATLRVGGALARRWAWCQIGVCAALWLLLLPFSLQSNERMSDDIETMLSAGETHFTAR